MVFTRIASDVEVGANCTPFPETHQKLCISKNGDVSLNNQRQKKNDEFIGICVTRVNGIIL